MTLPMGEGPPGGDFARYVEQLSAGPAPQAGAPARAGNGAQRGSRAAPRGISLKGGKGAAAAPLAGFKARLVAMAWVLSMVGLATWFIEPRTTPVALILVGAVFVVSLVRALARAVRKPS